MPRNASGIFVKNEGFKALYSYLLGSGVECALRSSKLLRLQLPGGAGDLDRTAPRPPGGLMALPSQAVLSYAKTRHTPPPLKDRASDDQNGLRYIPTQGNYY